MTAENIIVSFLHAGPFFKGMGDKHLILTQQAELQAFGKGSIPCREHTQDVSRVVCIDCRNLFSDFHKEREAQQLHQSINRDQLQMWLCLYLFLGLCWTKPDPHCSSACNISRGRRQSFFTFFWNRNYANPVVRCSKAQDLVKHFELLSSGSFSPKRIITERYMIAIHKEMCERGWDLVISHPLSENSHQTDWELSLVAGANRM